VPAVFIGAALLTGCAGDTDGELRRSVADLTDDANDRDADAVRDGAADLIMQVDEALRANEINPDQANRITELARQLGERADLLAPPEEPEPTVTPSPEPTEEPSPTDEPEETEEPSPEPTEEPEPDPVPTEEPEPTEEPSPEPEPTLVPELPGG
jgi:outer membrane biosynthesis protein TonB